LALELARELRLEAVPELELEEVWELEETPDPSFPLELEDQLRPQQDLIDMTS